MNANNNNAKFFVRLYHSKRNGEVIYRIVEFSNDKIVNMFESDRIKSCLDYFDLPSSEEYLVYWMFNCEEAEIYEDAMFSKN